MYLVRCTTIASQDLRLRPAIAIIRDSTITYIMDRSRIDKNLSGILSRLGNEVMSTMAPRSVPSATPWGRTRLPLVEASDPSVLIPVVTPNGIVCPLPRQRIALSLATELEALTDSTLRLCHPPKF